MDENQLNTLFSNGILVDSSIKDVNISDIDELIKSLKEKNINFLDIKTFHDLYDGEANTDSSIEIIKNYSTD